MVSVVVDVMLANVLADDEGVAAMIVVDVTIKGTVLVPIVMLELDVAWILPMYAIQMQ